MKSTTFLLSSIIALICAKNIKREGSQSRTLRIGSLFSGVGGLDKGIEDSLRSNGIPYEIVFFCENDDSKVNVLKKHWPNVPVYRDVFELLSEAANEHISNLDILIGGFPCQDVSSCNVLRRGKGFFEGDRTSLYFVISTLIDKIMIRNSNVPPLLIMENVSNIRTEGMNEGGLSPLGSIIADLNLKNYIVEYRLLRACDFGSPQLRERYFIVGYPCKENYFEPQNLFGEDKNCHDYTEFRKFWNKKNEPSRTVLKGTHNWGKRYKMIGDAVVPQVSHWVMNQVLLSGALNSFAFAGNIAQPVFPFKESMQPLELDPANRDTIPRKGALVSNFTVYPAHTYCMKYDQESTMPTLTTMPNSLSPSMQKHPKNKMFRRSVGLTQGESLSREKQLNINFVEWAGGLPKDWTKV